VDAAGRLTGDTDPDGPLSFEYDAAGRLTRKTSGDGTVLWGERVEPWCLRATWRRNSGAGMCCNPRYVGRGGSRCRVRSRLLGDDWFLCRRRGPLASNASSLDDLAGVSLCTEIGAAYGYGFGGALCFRTEFVYPLKPTDAANAILFGNTQPLIESAVQRYLESRGGKIGRRGMGAKGALSD